MTTSSDADSRAATLLHEGLLYTDPAGFLAGTVPFVHEGLAAGDPVLVAVPAGNLDLLRTALGPMAGQVRFVDMSEAGRNPGRIIPWVLHAFIQRHPRRRVRIIGEPIWSGRSDAEYPACVQHEALINWAFADRDAVILCPYDARTLTAEVLADVSATHPVVVDERGRRASTGYAPATIVERYARPPSPPSEGVAALRYDLETLPLVRRLVAEHARRAGLDADRTDDLEIVAAELATNSVTHGGGTGTVYVWQTPDHLVCEFNDPGRLSDPLTGRLPPAEDRAGGRGLVIVHALCDLVLVHSTTTGTTIRVHMRRP